MSHPTDKSPLHAFWYPRVAGQIQHTINAHPEWFAGLTEQQRQAMVMSITKRVIGEIVAGSKLAEVLSEVAETCV